MQGQYLIPITFLGLQLSNIEVRIREYTFIVPRKFQIRSSKLKRKSGKQQSCRLLWGYKCQSNVFVLFACHLLQTSCGQGDPSPGYVYCLCSLNYLFILGGCCQRVLLHAEPRAESSPQSDLKATIPSKKSTSFAVLENIKSW